VTENSSAPRPVAACNFQPDSGSQSLTRLIAPVFAAFSLPTIISFISSKHPGPPWHDVILSLLIAATGLFMASIQLSIGTLYNRYPNAGPIRAALTLFGIALIALSLFFLVWPTIDRWWLGLAAGVLLAGGVAPSLWILVLKLRGDDHSPHAVSKTKQHEQTQID
jgi:MFS family permease